MSTEQKSEERQQCAVCFEDRTLFVHFPCCGLTDGREDTTSTKICPSCIRFIAAPSDNICRCPRCRGWIRVTVLYETDDGGDSLQDQDNMPRVTVETLNSGKCSTCNQTKDNIVSRSGGIAYCDACYFGSRNPLTYECLSCHQRQTIPHPMYRYQSAWDEFGTASWACHQGCGDYTYWRILPNMIE